MMLDIDIGEGRWVTFGTPLIARQFDAVELNAALHRILLRREAKHPEMRTGQLNRSNVGGWRSEPDILDWPEPEWATLRRMIEECALQMMKLAGGDRPIDVRKDCNLVAWANINRRGNYNVSHSHPGSHWSGVYYVNIGQPDPDRPLNGIIEFQDPRPAAAALPIPGFDFGYKQTFVPAAGMMLLFPAWHLHMVHPFFGEAERISIAFNLRLRKGEPAQ
ncbi:MAG: hypothetical protein EXQ89_01475 [Rhodospirillaceae bacterium]|nr:hypothetical protein [Rhodospirillaceae bacterium]